MQDPDNGIISGTMSIATDPVSPNLLNVSYVDLIAKFQGATTPALNVDLNYFVLKSGDILAYVPALPTLTVAGVDDTGALCYGNLTLDDAAERGPATSVAAFRPPRRILVNSDRESENVR